LSLLLLLLLFINVIIVVVGRDAVVFSLIIKNNSSQISAKFSYQTSVQRQQDEHYFNTKYAWPTENMWVAEVEVSVPN
jgi:hypothetical protein